MAEYWKLDNPANKDKPTGDKDPDAVLDWPFEWAPWLDDINDGIKSFEIVVDAPLTVVAKFILGTAVVVFIAGGVAGGVYMVRCRITTNSTPSRIQDQTVYLFGKES